MNWTKRSTAALVLIATAGLITACGAGTTGGDTSAAGAPVAGDQPIVNKANWPEATPTSGLAKGLSLPLEDYMQTYEETVTLDQASRTLQEECMAGYGFSIQLPLAGATPPPNDNDANIERRYGITDRAAAAQYGYGLPDELNNQTRQKMPDLTDDQIEVLTGHTKPTTTGPDTVPTSEPAPDTYQGKKIHPGGCVGWSDSQIGQSQIDLSLVSELDGQSLTASQRTPAVQGAVSAWSQCMKTKGYDAATPYEAAEIVGHIDGAPSDEETAVAVADVDCKESTDLVAIWFKEDTAIQKKQIAEHLTGLTGARNQNTKALAAADKAVTG
ncbi:hypothetical protein ACIQNU_19230 [Streptomyces sp. NPDC091292]|uniref:hypothetical protein n=1 Tax=Streptomyces sp. NPDC091292 TaxID=3365991 RepID=UPI003810E571